MTSPFSLPHRAWRTLPPHARRRALAYGTAAAARLLRAPDRIPPGAAHGIAVAGELSRPSGLGEAARLMLRGLDTLGIRTWPLDIGTPDRALRPAACPPPGVPLVLHANPPVLPLALLRLPRAAVRNRRVIGAWAWELPATPRDWRPGARFVHEAWVLSRFIADAVEPLLPGRVRVVTPPLAADPPAPAALTRADFGLPDAAIVVLASFSLASSFERKNPLAAIAAFRAAFGDRPDRILILRHGDPAGYAPDLAALRHAAGDAPNIRLDGRVLPRADAHALTAQADIVLCLHRSEGFGLIPAEAMLLGRAVVATAWSGPLDFLDNTAAILIPAPLIPARDPRGVFEAPGAVWADPSIADAAAALRRLADDPALRASLGTAARRAAQTRLGTQTLCAAVCALGL